MAILSRTELPAKGEAGPSIIYWSSAGLEIYFKSCFFLHKVDWLKILFFKEILLGLFKPALI
jgi:hypothetical protein